jgi:hypothetical protein
MIMENIWSSEIDSILRVGHSLESVGVRNWALEREAALNALEQLCVLGVAVFGGDVYVANSSGVESNYDNWYCNRDVGETDVDFVVRSVAKARNYIANYRAEGRVLFAIVPNV